MEINELHVGRSRRQAKFVAEGVLSRGGRRNARINILHIPRVEESLSGASKGRNCVYPSEKESRGPRLPLTTCKIVSERAE